MNAKTTISEVMIPVPHSVGINQPVSIAKKFMKEYDVRHLPVQQGGKLVGILSERDIYFVMADGKSDEESLFVSDIYMSEPYLVKPSTPLCDVVKSMAENKYGCAVIVEEANDGKLLGIFTTVDACRRLAELLCKNN